MKIFQMRGLISAICVASILAGFTKVSAGPVRFEQVVQIINARPGSSQSGSFSRLRLASDNIFLVSDDDDDKAKIKTTLPQDDRVIVETRTDIVTDDVCDCEEVEVIKRGFPKWALLGLAAIPIAIILINRRKTPTPTPTVTPTPDITPTPTPGITPTPTPTPGITPTPTPTPGITPTPTPGITPTPTPTPGITPTPTPTPGITPTPTPGITPTPTPTPDITPTPTPTPGITPTPTPMFTPSPTPPEPVPEPMTILLFGTGLAGIGLAARRKLGKKKDIEGETEDE